MMKSKRILSALLAAMMLMAFIPAGAYSMEFEHTVQDSVANVPTATVEVTLEEFTGMVETAAAESTNGYTEITISVQPDAEIMAVEVTVPTAGLATLLESGTSVFSIITPNLDVMFDNDAIIAIVDQAAGDTVSIMLEKNVSESLTEIQRTTVGAQDFYNVYIASQDAYIDNLGDGYANIYVPYTPEDVANEVSAYFVDSEGYAVESYAEYVAGFANPETYMLMPFMILEIVPEPQPPEPEPETSEMPFEDVMMTDWYYDGVKYVYENSVMNGDTDTMFDPMGTATRAMLWTMLARIDGQDTSVGEMWYSVGMDWAIENGISDGSNPEGSISREELATMLYRYEQMNGGGFEDAWTFLLDYPDADMVSDWAYEAMCYMTMQEVITGKSNGNLDPAAGANRAEIATMFMRYLMLEDGNGDLIVEEDLEA